MQGPIIKTKFSGPTNKRGSIITATHKRDFNTTWKVVHKCEDGLSNEENHRAAADKLVATWPLIATGKIAACGYDAKYYYFLFALEAYN